MIGWGASSRLTGQPTPPRALFSRFLSLVPSQCSLASCRSKYRIQVNGDTRCERVVPERLEIQPYREVQLFEKPLLSASLWTTDFCNLFETDWQNSTARPIKHHHHNRGATPIGLQYFEVRCSRTATALTDIFVHRLNSRRIGPVSFRVQWCQF